MINFRFHLVSLVAVFLALAIGVVMGYGVLGQPTVETLQDRIDAVERRADAIRADNDQLAAEVERQETSLEALGAFAVTDRLTDVPVVVVAARGIDEDLVTSIVELARSAGADAPGVLWLEAKWSLESAEDRDALGDAIGTTTTRRSALRDQGWRALARRLVNGPSLEDPLPALVDAGFLAYQGVGEDGSFPLEDLGSPETLALLVLGDGATLAPGQVLAPFATAGTEAQLALVAGEVGREEDGSSRGEVVAPVRDDDTLSAQVSTVDDLDRPAGRIAAVLALADLQRGVIGHYGTGEGSAGVAPAWWPS